MANFTYNNHNQAKLDERSGTMSGQTRVAVDDNRYVVKIMGDEYVIRGNDSAAYMKQVAAYIEQQFESIAAKDLKLNKSQIAVLAALKIADELHKLRQEYQSLDQILNEAR